jgi:hypothetical protein
MNNDPLRMSESLYKVGHCECRLSSIKGDFRMSESSTAIFPHSFNFFVEVVEEANHRLVKTVGG